MEERDREKIAKNLSELSKKTAWNEALEEGLSSKNVFSEKMLQKIKGNSRSADERNRQLFTDVQRRGPKAFEHLVQILIESMNFESAKILDPAIDISALTARARGKAQSRESKVWSDPMYKKQPKEPLVNGVSSLHLDIPKVDDRIPLTVKVVTAKKFRGPPKYNAYPIGSSPRGLALIIDNERFSNDVLPFREGSQIDANNLDILFEQLGFKVTLRRNQSYEQMFSTIQSFIRSPEHKTADMCIVAILSHGDNGLVFASDGRSLPVEWILRQFNNQSCPELKGKPKFFIFQACRGDQADFGHIPKLETACTSGSTGVDAIGFKSVSAPVEKDPTWEDMLIAYATVPGYVANRNHFRGTWFIESICRVFMRNAAEFDIRELLDQVSQQMKCYESEFHTKQSCTYEVRHFYRKLYLNPGLNFEGSQPESTSSTPQAGTPDS